MAASSIPNLNTLRTGKGRGRGRGSSIAGGSSTLSQEEEKAQHDGIVQQTDQDAGVSRLSAVESGYLDDPYAYMFSTVGPQRRFPIINRGTYVRTKAIDKLVNSFVESNPSQRKQIISLGAGTDTRYFRMKARCPLPSKPNWVYHEIDFSANVVRKVGLIKKDTTLGGELSPLSLFNGDPKSGGDCDCTLDGPDYHLHPVDLRTLDPTKDPPPSFKAIDPSLPTLILSECCLCYLTPTAADNVALYFTKHLFPPMAPLGMIIYEPIMPEDAFGKTMVSNLAARGIVLQTLQKYGSLKSQTERLKAYGFTDSNSLDVNELWERAIDAKEKERVAGLEMFDEIEEWTLLASHYCVAWGWLECDGETSAGLWTQWKAVFQSHA